MCFISTTIFRQLVEPSSYSPAKVKEKNPDFNTQAGEQTFVWVGRFKHILCAMKKCNHLFYLHRMVLRRNSYTCKCYLRGKKPILPLARVVLVPFAYDPPPITPDVLDNLLQDAPAALPHALLVGKDLVMTESSTLRNLSTAVGDVLGSGVDGRLAMQYSLAILGAQTVAICGKALYTHTLYNSPSHRLWTMHNTQ